MALVSMAIQWLADFWEFYRGYTRSAFHAVAVAALTIFGLLIFIDPIFAVVAIISYLCPPIVLYVVGTDVGTDSKQANILTASVGSDQHTDGDSDSDNGDSDSDGNDGDTDFDADGADTDGNSHTEG